MFREDGLDLGRRFLRSLVFVITKRDLVDRSNLERLAAVPDGPGAANLERMCELAAKPTITGEESSELGQWILDAMFPGHRRKWENQIDSSRPTVDRRHWWKFHLCRYSRPQVNVFAVSLLGPELGRQVLDHRSAMVNWQMDGSRGTEPHIALDFERAETNSLDFHLPFTWMFDHLPEGLLHQARQLSDSVSEGATISVQWEPPDRLRRESFEGARKEG